ncbi:type IA DNA topoisomerase (plasmid) [Aliarcobacter lanthieri]|uniref:type IA DNA topoisomerase n=1 Tax=Aliarcobacter lanthieri TaxID=1355374 RepID=UPI003AAD93DC
MYNLMIVEAPPKAKKIETILKNEGLHFKVVSTAGYLVDLPKNEYALNFDKKSIGVKWVYGTGKKKLLDDIKELSKNAKNIYIATDDDREGEKIANDLVEKLNLKETDYYRVVFTAITKSKILYSINNPRDLAKDKVIGAVTRRILDREIGYPVSEIMRYDLRKKGYIIPNNLGCGRTISPTLHLLNENQKEIDSFEQEEYFRIKVWYQKDGVHFQGLHEARFMKESSDNKMQLELILGQMRNNPHTVIRHTPKNREESPPDPLTTVTLQQSASNLYGMKGKDTMKYAQLLYYQGYISYHRTDSNTQSEETYLEIINFLGRNFHEDDILPTKRNIKQKGKNVQEGHDAIQVVYIDENYHPDKIKEVWIKNNQWLSEKDDPKTSYFKFTNEHLQIYEIIWYRTLAVQMRNAVFDASETIIDIAGNTIELTSNKLKTVSLYDGGEKVLNGWLGLKSNLLRKSTMVEETDFKNDERFIPIMQEGEEVSVVDITLVEGKTRPPYHYGEGRLIKTIDNAGIVRPSTLATVLPSLESKKCIMYVGNIVKITRLGQIVDDWVSEYAPWLNDIQMAQKFEEILDKISNNEKDIDETDFIMEYHERIEALKELIGYEEESKIEVADWQIEKALKIAHQKGIELSDDVLNSREKIDIFLSTNAPKVEYESLGKCPSCKKGKVKENNLAYGCSEFRNGCKFTLWKKNIFNFFERFGAQVTDSYITNIIIGALKKEPLLFIGLKSSKGQFDAFIDIKFNKEYSSWSLDLKFDNAKKANIKQDQIVKLDRIKIKTTIKNFKSNNELEKKLKSYFFEEGYASLCYGKIIIPELKNFDDKTIDEIGFYLKEYLHTQNSDIFINDEKTVISILSFQASSNQFIRIIEEAKIKIRTFSILENKKIGFGIVFRRFYHTISEMELELNENIIKSIQENKIIYKGEF